MHGTHAPRPGRQAGRHRRQRGRLDRARARPHGASAATDGELADAGAADPGRAAATPPALAEVAHRIGDVDRVLVLGTDELRTALEREIVAIGHRPETIREAAACEGPVEPRAALLARLRRLA